MTASGCVLASKHQTNQHPMRNYRQVRHDVVCVTMAAAEELIVDAAVAVISELVSISSERR